MMRLFMLVALSVLIATAVRWLLRRVEIGRLLRQPGRRANKPISVHRYDQIDDAVAGQRCVCGGALRTVSEGGTAILRVVHTECRRCQESVDLYFDLSSIRH